MIFMTFHEVPNDHDALDVSVTKRVVVVILPVAVDNLLPPWHPAHRLQVHPCTPSMCVGYGTGSWAQVMDSLIASKCSVSIW